MFLCVCWGRVLKREGDFNSRNKYQYRRSRDGVNLTKDKMRFGSTSLAIVTSSFNLNISRFTTHC